MAADVTADIPRLVVGDRVVARNGDETYTGVVTAVHDPDQGDFEYSVRHDDGEHSFWPREDLTAVTVRPTRGPSRYTHVATAHDADGLLMAVPGTSPDDALQHLAQALAADARELASRTLDAELAP